MKKKWIGLFFSLLLLGGSITPSVCVYTIDESTTVPNETVQSTTSKNSIDNSDESSTNSTEDSSQTSASEANNKITEDRILISEENFPDANFRNLLLKTIDIDKDCYLSEKELQQTELNLSDQKIQTLEGIQSFKNLEKLEVQRNELKELDVHFLTSLTYLDVSENQLEKIDLSKNNNLTYFKGSEQSVTATAQQINGNWTIEDGQLQPEQEQVELTNQNWQYDSFTFISTEKEPLSYNYHIRFSNQALLEEDSERSLSVNINVEFKETESNFAAEIKPIEEVTHLTVGDRKQLGYTIVPENAVVRSFLWETADSDIVEVDSNGQVTANKVGETIVNLKDSNKLLATFKIIVSDKEKGSNEVSKSGQTNKLFLDINPVVIYQTHIQAYGWQPEVHDGETAGTVGQHKRLEALKIHIANSPLEGNIEYSSHVQSLGWQDYVKNGFTSGTTNRSLRNEAVRIRLTGEIARYYDIYYRVHSAYFGWLGWTKNGGSAGSSGFGYQMEALQIKLVKKSDTGPAMGKAYYQKDQLDVPDVNYQTHSQLIGWQGYKKNGAIAGTIGKGLRLEAIRMNISNTPLPGTIEYSSYIQSIGWQDYVNNNKQTGTIGRKLRIEAIRIRLTGQLNQFYDVYYRVHSAKLGWLDWARNGQNAGTSNIDLQMEAIQVVLVKKGSAAPGPVNNPYQTAINHLFVMGHGVNDPGASYNGINERDFTRGELLPVLQKWANKLSKNRIIFYNTNSDMYQDSRRLQGAYTISDSFSSVSEFHLDSGIVGVSTGGHVIAHRNGNSLTRQNYAIANIIRRYVGLWGSVQSTGGINLRSDLLNMNVLKSRGIPYRLAELGFITNTKDVANIRNNIDSIAKGIVESVTGEDL